MSFRIQKSILLVIAIMTSTGCLYAAKKIPLTLDYAVKIAMTHSTRIKRLRYSIDRNLYWLKARQAGLKSNVFLNLKSPDLQNVSEYRWNSVLYRDEIVRLNTQMWESELSVKQPVILLGYPTNGYLSLNYRLYRYQQNEEGNKEVDYYNRLYIQFEQPFFLPNELKNDLEDAELNLKENQLDYVSERMDILNDIADDYYDAFELVYYEKIYLYQISQLKEILEIAKKIGSESGNNRKDIIQIQLEMANVRENLLDTRSRLRMELTNMKQRLNFDVDDSLWIESSIQLDHLYISLDDAIRYGSTLNPQLKRLGLQKRKAEINLENIKGWNAFHMKLHVTYGLEKSNHVFNNMWQRYDDSNSITLNAYLPIWDWGKHRYEIMAGQKLIDQRELNIDEQQKVISLNNSQT